MDQSFGHGRWAALSAVSSGQAETFQRILIADSDTPSQHAKVTSGGGLLVSAGGGFGSTSVTVVLLSGAAGGTAILDGATSSLLVSAMGGAGIATPMISGAGGGKAILDQATSALCVSAVGGGAGVSLPSAVQWTPTGSRVSSWLVALTDGTNAAAITAASALFVSAANLPTLLSAWAVPAGQLTVSAQLSGGGLLSAWAVPAGQLTVSAQLSGGGLLSAWAVPAGQLTVSAQLSGGGLLSAWCIPAAQLTVSAQLSATSLVSAWCLDILSATGTRLTSVAFELSATSAVVGSVAASAIYVYAVKAISEASGGWHRWAASGGSIVGLEGYQKLDAFGGYVENVKPPAYLYQSPAGSALILQSSALVSALAGRLSYWQG